MHRMLIESILADASYDLLVPATDSQDPDEIASSPARATVFYDETLLFYLVVKTGPSAAKIEPQVLQELATKFVEVHVVATLCERVDPTRRPPSSSPSAAAGSAGSGSLGGSQKLSAGSSAGPPPASSGRSRAETTAFGRRSTSLFIGAPSPSLPGGSPSMGSGTVGSSGATTVPLTGSSTSPILRQRATERRASASSGSLLGLLQQNNQQPLSLQQQQQQQQQHLGQTGFANGSQPTEELLFSYTYTPRLSSRKPLIAFKGSFILFPLVVRLDCPKFDEETLLQGAICDPENFDGVNVFANLHDDPLFDQVPSFLVSNQYKRLTPPQQPPFRRSISTNVSVYPPFSISINTTNSGPGSLLLAICIEKNEEHHHDDFLADIDSVQVQMTNAFVNPFLESVSFPIKLHGPDQLFLLYQVTLIEETPTKLESTVVSGLNHLRLDSFPATPSASMANLASLGPSDASKSKQDSDHMRLVSITLKSTPHTPGMCSQKMSSAWYVKLRAGPDGSLPDRHNVPAFHGRRFELGKAGDAGRSATAAGGSGRGGMAGAEVGGEGVARTGLEFSFNVMTRVFLRHVFRVQVLVVNHSPRERNLSLIIPQSAPSHELTRVIKRDPLPKLHMDTAAFVRMYSLQNEDEVSIACLEGRMDLRPIPPNACQLVNLHYIVIKGQIHRLPPIVVLDRDTDTRSTIRDALVLFVDQHAAPALSSAAVPTGTAASS
ncbi:hypothetical protein BC831DRAFT_441976 [Entophlyctis helioformis]|nr:hypothetical protein BC831DRAFT_441976 [Entophlyctis helioformis]